jgi:hypothetical protein
METATGRSENEEPSRNATGRSENEEPSCSLCRDSGFYGFSVCTWCDGVPKPIKNKSLQTALLVKRQTSSHFLVHECSESAAPIGTAVEQECKLCYADVAHVVLRSCGHGGFCEGCTRRLAGEKSTAFCPYCRAPIQAFVKIDPKFETSVVCEEFQVKVSRWTR